MAGFMYRASIHGAVKAEWFYSGTVEAESLEEAREKVKHLVEEDRVAPHAHRLGDPTGIQEVADGDVQVEELPTGRLREPREPAYAAADVMSGQ